MVIIRPSFYIINDAFSEFVAITIFLLEGLSQFYTPLHFLEKKLLFFSLPNSSSCILGF